MSIYSDEFVDFNTLDGKPLIEYLDPTRGLLHSILHCRLYHKHLVKRISFRNPADLKSVSKVLSDIASDYTALSEVCLGKWRRHDEAFRRERAEWEQYEQESNSEVRQQVLGELRSEGRLLDRRDASGRNRRRYAQARAVMTAFKACEDKAPYDPEPENDR